MTHFLIRAKGLRSKGTLITCQGHWKVAVWTDYWLNGRLISARQNVRWTRISAQVQSPTNRRNQRLSLLTDLHLQIKSLFSQFIVIWINFAYHSIQRFIDFFRRWFKIYFVRKILSDFIKNSGFFVLKVKVSHPSL